MRLESLEISENRCVTIELYVAHSTSATPKHLQNLNFLAMNFHLLSALSEKLIRFLYDSAQCISDAKHFPVIL